MKEIDKYGNLYKDSEIYLDEIQLLAVKNYKIMEGDYEKKFRFCILFILIFLFNTLIVKVEREIKYVDSEIRNGIIYSKNEKMGLSQINDKNHQFAIAPR